MNDQLSAVVHQNVSAPLGNRHLIPALIADLGEQASWRYVEFFTACSATIRMNCHIASPRNAPEP